MQHDTNAVNKSLTFYNLFDIHTDTLRRLFQLIKPYQRVNFHLCKNMMKKKQKKLIFYCCWYSTGCTKLRMNENDADATLKDG